MSSTVDEYYPIYLTPQKLDSGDSDKAKVRAIKVNSIIQQTYNSLVSKTQQKKLDDFKLNQIVSYSKNRVWSLKDYGYMEYHAISFTMSTANMKEGSITECLTLRNDLNIYNEYIPFTGLNSSSRPTDVLQNYGYFIYTNNKVNGDLSISFYAYKDCPATTNWGIYMTLVIGDS